MRAQGEVWHGRPARELLVGQTFLSAIESVSGGTFLSLPNGFESARVARMPPLADSRQTRMSAPPFTLSNATPAPSGIRHRPATLRRSAHPGFIAGTIPY